MASYTRGDLYTAVNSRLHNKLGVLANSQASLNSAVRSVWNDIDFRSAKRMTSTPLTLFEGVYQYACPTDLKDTKIVDIQPQTGERRRLSDWQLTTPEQFDRWKQSYTNLLAISDKSLYRSILASINPDIDLNTTISPLDSITSAGTWGVFSSGSTSVATDTANFVQGGGSIKFAISATAGQTTAGIVATDVTTYDLTDYLSSGYVFLWVYITSTTNLTNYKVRLGSDSSNYYELTATTTNEGLAFQTGWNFLKFAFSSKTTTGTPDDDNCDYVAMYMTKDAAKVSESDYRFDYLFLASGELYNVIYYTEYPWQTSGGTFLLDSTTSSDYLNIDAGEFAVLLEGVITWIAREAREYRDAEDADRRYQKMKTDYQSATPSEALLLTTNYYEFGTVIDVQPWGIGGSE